MARPTADGPVSDADLLTRFTGQRDEEAFEEIVRRHGPLVWALCRSRLTAADADDAFQATFLVLARQARHIRKPASLAFWLSGVTRRVVRHVREQDDRRRAAEQKAGAGRREAADTPEPYEWRSVLDEELHRLSEKYRLPLLLCYYQGLTNEEAARRLGWPHGTICGRLARARDLLRRRLTRRGMALTACVLAAGTAGPPSELVAATMAACGSVAESGAAGAIRTGTALLLAEGVMDAMWMGKVKLWACGLVVVTAVGGGGRRCRCDARVGQCPEQSARRRGRAAGRASASTRPSPDGQDRGDREGRGGTAERAGGRRV
jgi:RNA polymerase sigma factor (sigma-70 family)